MITKIYNSKIARVTLIITAHVVAAALASSF